MNRLLILMILAGASLLTACEQAAEVQIPEYEQKLVVEGILRPDTISTLALTLSQPYHVPLELRDRSEQIKDATVVLHGSQGSIPMVLDSNSFGSGYEYYYSTNHSFKTGEQYELEVIWGERTVTASTVIPRKAGVKNVGYNPERFDSLTGAYYPPQLQVQVDDPPPVGDNYLVVAEVYDPSTGNGFNTSTYYQEFARDLFATNPVAEVDIGWHNGFSDSLIVTVRVLNYPDAYVEYHESLFEASNSMYDPFSEVVNVRTNIEGGLGIFSAYSVSEPKTIIIKF